MTEHAYDPGTMTALILAGVRPSGDPFAEEQGVAHKSLIEIEGEPILARVHAALSAAGFGRIAVSTNCAEVATLARSLGAEVVASERGPSVSVASAFAQYGAPMLVTTSDHALLQPEWVRDFVADSEAGADVTVMLARRDVVEIALPGSKRTYLRFADGEWSGCNLFLLATPAASGALHLWSEVEANRKRPWRIAIRLGIGTLLSYALGRLTLSEAVAKLGRRAGIEARVVAARDGLAAVDIDKSADLAQVRALIVQRAT